MSWISVGGAAVSGVFSLIKGGKQKREARRLAEANKRPTYNIPKEIEENVALARQRSNQGLPSEQYQKAQQDIERNKAATLRQATERRGGLEIAGAVQQQSDDATLNLNATDAQARVANIERLVQENRIKAQYQDKQFDYNERQKYEENAAAIRALNEAGSENQNTALNSFLSAGAFTANKAIQDNWFKGKPKSGTDGFVKRLDQATISTRTSPQGLPEAPKSIDPTLNRNLFPFNSVPDKLAEYLKSRAAMGISETQGY